MLLRYLLAVALLFPASLRAQTGRLVGTLRDEHQQPLPFASVVLRTAPDSVGVQESTNRTGSGL